MAAPRSKKNARHSKLITQRTWRLGTKDNTTRIQTHSNQRTQLKHKEVNQFPLLAHLSTGHFRLDLKRDMQTLDAPSGRSTGIAYGHDSNGSEFFVHLGHTK